jgi:hypothetical protein
MKTIKIILPFVLIIIFGGCRQIFGDKGKPESVVPIQSEAEKIIVNTPEHGSIWERGDVIIIKWIAPSIEKIKIQLFRKTNLKLTIDAGTENDGLYEWTIPDDIPLSNHYLFKLSSQNDSDIFEFSGRFGIQ